MPLGLKEQKVLLEKTFCWLMMFAQQELLYRNVESS